MRPLLVMTGVLEITSGQVALEQNLMLEKELLDVWLTVQGALVAM